MAALALFATVPAAATVLTVDSGWQDDQISSAGQPTDKSIWTFTVAKPAVLSITDAFIPGDVYTISGDLTGLTSFFPGAPTDAEAAGSYGAYWTDLSYSKVALLIAPGSYSFWITGDGAGGMPAGLGVRLDTSTSAVPEPASWALMALAFAAVGMAMRGRSPVSKKSA